MLFPDNNPEERSRSVQRHKEEKQQQQQHQGLNNAYYQQLQSLLNDQQQQQHGGYGPSHFAYTNDPNRLRTLSPSRSQPFLHRATSLTPTSMADRARRNSIHMHGNMVRRDGMGAYLSSSMTLPTGWNTATAKSQQRPNSSAGFAFPTSSTANQSAVAGGANPLLPPLSRTPELVLYPPISDKLALAPGRDDQRDSTVMALQSQVLCRLRRACPVRDGHAA